MRPRITARATTPPTTPPAIAPTLGPLDGGGVLVDVDTHFVVEQLSHVCAVMVQVWPSGQAGQVGTESHVTQRLKREREGVKPSMGEREEGSTGLRSMMGDG